MQPVFTSVKIKRLITASQPASNANDKLVSQAKVVYTYKCSCDLSYIGYTARYLYQRIDEHRRRSSSSIHQHCQGTGHEFKVTNFKVLAKCKTKLDCMIRESHEIYFRKPALNARDEYGCSILYRLRLQFYYTAIHTHVHVHVKHLNLYKICRNFYRVNNSRFHNFSKCHTP